MPTRRRIADSDRPLILKGSYLTDGKSFWKVERVDEQFVWVSQPGTCEIPLSFKTIAGLKEATPPAKW